MIATRTSVPTPASSVGDGAPRPPVSASRRVAATGAIGVAGWVAVVVAGRAVGQRLIDDGIAVVLYTPPVLGGDRASIPVGLWLPIVVAVVLVVVLPRLVQRVPWSAVVVASTGGAAVWWLALALVDGARGLTRGLYWDADYADSVPRAAADAHGFLESYVGTLPDQPIALRGHPPGFVMLFGGLDRLGLTGPGWAAAVTFAVGVSAVAAVLITVRLIAGEDVARRAGPFLALCPAGIWIVTSTDALSMGTAAWTVALVALAGVRRGRRSDALAAGAGLLAAFTAMQSYGLVLMALPVLLVAHRQRRARPTCVAGSTALLVVAATGLTGFSWVAGLFATIHEYRTLELERPHPPFLIINLAAWALALGPATVAGLAALRDRRLWTIVGGGLLAAGVAAVSGLSNGEVERIWLPFTIWVLPAAVALWSSRRAAGSWLTAQALTALAVTASIGTNW
jgi:hypothetical protein